MPGTWFYGNPNRTDQQRYIVVSLSSDKYTYCKLLWIKASSKCPKCKKKKESLIEPVALQAHRSKEAEISSLTTFQSWVTQGVEVSVCVLQQYPPGVWLTGSLSEIETAVN